MSFFPSAQVPNDNGRRMECGTRATCKHMVDLLNGLDCRFYRFSLNFSAICLVIPACLHMEFNVPCRMLLLFRGTITTLPLPLDIKESGVTSCIVNKMVAWHSWLSTVSGLSHTWMLFQVSFFSY